MPERTYSIAVRLRRTVTEEAYVSVPVSDEVMSPEPDENGNYHLDGDKVMEAAVNLGSDPKTHWKIEGKPVIEPHPIQMARPN